MVLLFDHSNSRLLGRISDHILYKELDDNEFKFVIFNHTSKEIDVYLDGNIYKIYSLTSRGVPYAAPNTALMKSANFEIEVPLEGKGIFITDTRDEKLDEEKYFMGYRYWINKYRKSLTQIKVTSPTEYDVVVDKDNSYSYMVFVVAIIICVVIIFVAISYGTMYALRYVSR